jgi:hypothetical protein
MHERPFLSEAVERLIALVDDIEGFIVDHPTSPLPELAHCKWRSGRRNRRERHPDYA